MGAVAAHHARGGRDAGAVHRQPQRAEAGRGFQRGRDIVWKYLASADKVLGGPSFTYVGEWLGDNSAILEFNCTVDGISIDGIDMITWNDEGQIVHFKVMVRPLKAVNMVHQKMGEMLQKMTAGAA